MVGVQGDQTDYGSALLLPLAQALAGSRSQQVVAIYDDHLGTQPLTSPWDLRRALPLPFHSEEAGPQFPQL